MKKLFCALVVAAGLLAQPLAAQAGPAGPKAPALKPGDSVLAPRTSAEYVMGKLVAPTDRGWKVELENGDVIECVQDELAFVQPPRPDQVKPGVGVVAQWTDGAWYTARVEANSPDGIDIIYTDGTAERSDTGRLRIFLPPRPPAVAAAPAPAPGGQQPPPGAPGQPGPAQPGQPGKPGQPASGQPGQPAPGQPRPGQPAPGADDGMSPPLGAIFGEMATTYKWIWQFKAPAGAKGMSWSDADIEITVPVAEQTALTGPDFWAFSLRNKSKGPIAVVWDKSWVTSTKGTKRPTVHGNLTRVNFEAAQAPTQIRAGEKVDEAIVPKAGFVIYHHKGEYNDRGEWVEPWDQIDGTTLFFGEDFRGLDGYDQIRKALVGREFTLHLTLAIGGKEKPYDFVFKVAEIERTKNENPFGFNP